MLKNGYKLLIKDTPEFKSAGFGTTALKKDKFSPTVSLNVFPHFDQISIEVSDRHGSNIVGEGRTLGYYKFDKLDNSLIDRAINDIVSTFGDFNIDNPVPTRWEKVEILYKKEVKK